MTDLDLDRARICICACCADAVERARTDRNPFAGCNCHDYPEALHCDCNLCAAVLAWGVSPRKSKEGKVKPKIGTNVHYVSYGTPGGEYQSACRAATIAGLPQGALPVADSENAQQWDSDAVVADLVVFNPKGVFFDRCPQSQSDRGGTWHLLDQCDDRLRGQGTRE